MGEEERKVQGLKFKASSGLRRTEQESRKLFSRSTLHWAGPEETVTWYQNFQIKPKGKSRAKKQSLTPGKESKEELEKKVNHRFIDRGWGHLHR